MNTALRGLHSAVLLLGLLALLDGFAPMRSLAGLWSHREPAVLASADERHLPVFNAAPSDPPAAILPAILGPPRRSVAPLAAMPTRVLAATEVPFLRPSARGPPRFS